jgi:hypothetical protein
MLDLVAIGSVHSGPDARRHVGVQAGCRHHCYPLCWRVDDLRVWSLVHIGSAVEAELAVEDMVASRQRPEVVAGSWELVVHTLKVDSTDMEVGRPDAWVCRHFRTWAALEVAE